MYIHTLIFTNIHTHMCIRIHMPSESQQADTCTYIHSYINININAYIIILNKYIDMHTYVRVLRVSYTHIHKHKYTCTHIYILNIYTYVCIHIYICTHTYIRAWRVSTAAAIVDRRTSTAVWPECRDVTTSVSPWRTYKYMYIY